LTVFVSVYIVCAWKKKTPGSPPTWFCPSCCGRDAACTACFIRDALTEAGFTDMPGPGGYVLGLIAPEGTPLGEVISDLGVAKQTASQLVDTLVVRGYLERSEDPDDRRRVLLALTERGRSASAVVQSTAQEVDARLVAVVGAEHMQHTKETLVALLNLHPSSSALKR
jgi:DNA-binding MarR family transcriptional regulator